jgi:hypothetical protein
MQVTLYNMELHAQRTPALHPSTFITAVDPCPCALHPLQVSLAIIDACPVRANKYLPEHYAATMQQLQKRFLPDATSARRVPEWGQRIFSPHCVCIRPSGAEELAGFIKYSIALSRAHLMYSRLLTPITPINRRDALKLEEIAAGQRCAAGWLADIAPAVVLLPCARVLMWCMSARLHHQPW